MVKKFLLSAALVVIFAFYVFHQRSENPTQVAALPTEPVSPSDTSPAGVSSPAPVGTYRDGSYTGEVADAFYGNIQVQAIVTGGKISDVRFLQYPNDRPESIQVSSQSIPLLKQEAIQSQNAQVDIVTGATQTSQAFIQSLGSALEKAM